MSEDFTNTQSQSDNHILTLILTTLQSLGGHIISFDGRFSSLERHFDRLETRVDRLDSRLENVEQGLKNVQADVIQLQKSHEGMRGDIAQLRKGQEEMRGEIRDLNSAVGEISHNQTVLSDTVRKMDHDFRDIKFSAAYVATVGIHLPEVYSPNSYGGAEPQFAPYTRFDSAGQPIAGFGAESVITSASNMELEVLRGRGSEC